MWLRAKHRVLVACSWRLNDADFVGIYDMVWRGSNLATVEKGSLTVGLQ